MVGDYEWIGKFPCFEKSDQLCEEDVVQFYSDCRWHDLIDLADLTDKTVS